MKRLGRFLLDRGLITEDQLSEALHCQTVFGGRLGTNVVELGYISLEDLARLLAVATDTPLAPQEWLEKPDPAALERVPRELCEEHHLLPLKLDDEGLHIGMIEPSRPGVLEQLSEATGETIRIYIVPELRMFVWLEKHLGIRRRIRFQRLGSKTATRGPHSGTLVGGPADADPQRRQRLQSLGVDRSTVDFSEVEGDLEIIVEPQLPELSAELLEPVDPEVDLTPPRSPHDVAALEARMANAESRTEVAHTALRLARGHCETAALFIAHRGMLHGFCGVGGSLHGQDLQAIYLPASSRSCLGRAATDGAPYRTRQPDGEVNIRLLRALGRHEVFEVAALPIRIRGRVVNVLYADNGPDPVGDTAFAALVTLAERVGAAYENLILRRKQIELGTSPAQS